MDLGAYKNIESLSDIAAKNNIVIPRLRGYRLMKDEKQIDIKEIYINAEATAIHDACESMFGLYGDCYLINSKTRKLFKYCSKKENGIIRINWDNIHGKKRKFLKLYIKQMNRKIERQYSVYNKYCGMDNILYIHARIGSNNWLYYGGNNLEKEPWFIERVDDYLDSTYCDIYAKITNIV